MTKWLKKEGDAVNEYDPVLELQTDSLYGESDKAESKGPTEMVVEMAEAGFVGRVLIKEGEEVDVSYAPDCTVLLIVCMPL